MRRSASVPWLILVSLASLAGVGVFMLLAHQLSTSSPVCEGPTFDAARRWQFDAEKLALLSVAVNIAAVAACLYVRTTEDDKTVRLLLAGAVVLLAGGLVFSAFVAMLGWSPCLNT